MEETKKRRRPNLFDILIIVLVLAAVAVAYILSHDGFSQKTVTTRSYLLELADLPQGMEDSVHVGDTVTDNIKNYEIGTVTGIELIPSTNQVLDEDGGVFRPAPVDGLVTLLLTIEVPTVETEQSIDTVSGYTLRVGAQTSCSVGALRAAGYIVALDREGVSK